MVFESANIRISADDQIATLWLDASHAARNTITPEFLADLESALDTLDSEACRSRFDLVLLRSAKSTGFLHGLDLKWQRELDSTAAVELSTRGQQLCDRLATTSGPITLALLDGPCLSQGAELALACDYRIMVERPSTVIGFPDVLLGGCPSWGGTARLPRLVGAELATRMLTEGFTLPATQAKAACLVDELFMPKSFRGDLWSLLGSLQDRPRRPSRGWRRWWQANPITRPLSLRRAIKAAQERFEDHDSLNRPEIHLILAAIQAGFHDPTIGQAAERRAVGLISAPESVGRQHLLRLDEISNSKPTKIFPEPLNPTPELPSRIGIVGGGDLGARLAHWFARQGCRVSLQEQSDQSLTRADQRLRALFGQSVRENQLSEGSASQLDAMIRRTITWQGFEDCGWVIEAVEEDAGVKHGVFHELEQRVMPRVPLTSAGSTVRIESLQAELQRPGRVAGVHWLAPVEGNRIVELVRGSATEPDTLAALDAWLRQLGKTPVLVSDRPGRVVMRLMLAYLSEAALLVAEGLPPELIDRQMRRFGMSSGPLETIDFLGFEALAGLVQDMQLARGDEIANNLLLNPLREAGMAGRPNGEGFYLYACNNGVKQRANPVARMLMWRSVEEPDVQSHYVFDPEEALREGEQRLLMRMVNEAARLLGEEHSAGPETIDLAMAHGTGWAPHRGGPLRYADTRGLGSVVDTLTRFTERFGSRFEPCLELQRRAEASESFHGAEVLVTKVPTPERVAA